MPIKKSAKKALRQNKRRHTRNTACKKKVRKIVKETKALVSSGKIEEAKKTLSAVYKALDKAAKEKVIKKNAASRKKSRVARLISKAKA